MFNPPWHADLTPKPLPAASTTMDNRRQSGLWAHNARTGEFEQRHPPPGSSGPYQYYQPPRRSFSERAAKSDSLGDANGVARSNSQNQSSSLPVSTDEQVIVASQASQATQEGQALLNSGDAAAAEHVNATTSSSHPTTAADPSYDELDDDVPTNLRAKPWSPEPLDQPTMPEPSAAPVRQASDASNVVRRNSVPHRSPLQKLEGHLDTISKEEKRARVEEAENKARKKSLSAQGRPSTSGEEGVQRTNTLRSEKGRVISNESARSARSASDQLYQNQPRGVSTAEPPVGENGVTKFKRASDGLRISTSQRAAPPNESVASPRTRTKSSSNPGRQSSTRQRQDPPIAHEARPYHHAPSAPREMGVRADPQPYHHAPETPRDLGIAQRPISNAGNSVTAGTTSQRSSGANYRPRLRDAGYAGAGAVAAAGGAAVAGYEISAAERGRAAHERRKSQEQNNLPPSVRNSQASSNANVARAESQKLPYRGYPMDGTNDATLESRRQSQPVYPISGRNVSGRDAPAVSSPTTAPTSQDQNAMNQRDASSFPISSQAETAKPAKKQVGFSTNEAVADAGIAGAGAVAGAGGAASSQDKHRSLGGLFHGEYQRRAYVPSGVTSDEWRSAQIARLNLSDLEFDSEAPQAATKPKTKDAAWWEKSRATAPADASQTLNTGVSAAQMDGAYEEEAMMFQPQLFLKCGPLLRYTGIRREKGSGASGADERAIWRGTVMIVTEDAQSDLSSAPTLRLFAQPMDLLQPPSREAFARGENIPPEWEDPLAGQMKVSRTGRPIYVRPVHEIDGGVDLSLTEKPTGLYSATRTPLLGPQNEAGDGNAAQQNARIVSQDKSRIRRRDGEKAGRYKDVTAVRLYTERGFTFWRFSLEIELGSSQHRVAYRINSGPALGFWVPGRSQSMNIMFHSCNGFSLSVNPDDFSGPDPLWRDVLSKHQIRPFHVMVGGGDQIYNDAATRDTKLFGEWIRQKNPEHKQSAPFSAEMQEELEHFYLDRYAMWFSQGLFAMAGCHIPMVNIWDDHDIMDGYGSYPHRLMASSVFTGLGAVAFKYYMLFQHQSLAAETEKEEPSWVLGSGPGPYINERSRSLFLDLGPHLKFLGIDCRTERMRDEIVSQETYDLLFQRCEKEIQKGETKHLIVLLGVPIAYPRLNFLENILTSRVMDPIKAIGRTGMLGGFVNKFDGGVEILDDLDDHWTAKHHKLERNWFIQELQEFASQRSVRVTILGGDVHLGAVGQFYTPRKFGINKDKDHRYMPNVISSAIVNTPPPTMMADVLNRRNKVHHLDSETDEDLIPMFEYDVDGSKRNNKCLLPRRNYCTIREFLPGSTPPPTPSADEHSQVPPTPGSVNSIQDEGLWSARRPEEQDRRFPPGSMRRTMSLTRSGASTLIRRLSGSGRSRNGPGSNAPAAPRASLSERPRFFGGSQPTELVKGRSNSLSGPGPGAGGSYFPPTAAPAGETPQRPEFKFHRRPTALSEKEIRKALAKGGAPPDEDNPDAVPEIPPVGHINLEGGLDISLNMEINQRDPAGHTQPYRLLVPALFYEGALDMNPTRLKTGRTSFIQRLSSVRRRKQIEDQQDYYDDDAGYDRSRSPSPAFDQQQQHQFQQGWQPQQQPQQQNTTLAGRGLPPSSAVDSSARPNSMGQADGSFDQRSKSAVAAATRNSIEATHTRGAYDKGFNLSAPPIGAGHFGGGATNGPPASSAPDQPLQSPLPPSQAQSLSQPERQFQPQPRPQTQARQQARPAGGVYGYSQPTHEYADDGGSLSPSVEDRRGYSDDEDGDGSLSPFEEDPRSDPKRRSSNKAERFFGVGDAPVPGHSGLVGTPVGKGNAGARKKPAWKIWGS